MTLPQAGSEGVTARAPRSIPEASVARLAVYLRMLGEMAEQGADTVSSEELATATGVNSAKLRKDLSYVGSHGIRGVGYEVGPLLHTQDRSGETDQNGQGRVRQLRLVVEAEDFERARPVLEAMGALAEVTIPRDKRWIPKGMEVAYTAKATSDIRCIAETDQAQWDAADGDLPVGARSPG